MAQTTATHDRMATTKAYRSGGGLSVPAVGMLMTLPVVAIVAAFTVYAFGHAIYESTQLSSPFFPPRFVGLGNYQSVIGSPYFSDAVRVTVTFALFAVPLVVVLGLLIALLLNERFPGNTFLRAGMLLPWALPASITGVVWKFMFLDSWGAVNVMLYELGAIDAYIPWLTTPQLAMMAVLVAFAWAQSPLAAALLLVSLQAVPRELYDAAALDGAGALNRFRSITLPGIRPMLVIVTLYILLMAITTFDIAYSLTHGGPGTATTMLTYFTWSESFKMLNFGNGAALAILIALASIGVIVILLRAMPRNALLGEAR